MSAVLGNEELMIRQHVVCSELKIKGVPHLDPYLTEWLILCVASGSAALWDEQRYYVSNPLAKDPDEAPFIRGLTGILRARGLVPAI